MLLYVNMVELFLLITIPNIIIFITSICKINNNIKSFLKLLLFFEI